MNTSLFPGNDDRVDGDDDADGELAPSELEPIDTAHSEAAAVARDLCAVLPGVVPAWMEGAFAFAAAQLAAAKKAPLTVTALAEYVLRSRQGAPLGRHSSLTGQHAWPGVSDPYALHKLQMVAAVLLARIRDPDAPVLLFSLPHLLEQADETAFAAEFIDNQSWSTIRRLALSGAFRHVAPLPSPGALTTLAAEMPNFLLVVDFYRGQIALAAMQGAIGATLPPVLLLGSPGIGKTTFVRRLAAILNSHFAWLQFASASAGWLLGGLDRTWQGARPGRVFNTLLQQRVANPILLLDEIDKSDADTKFEALGPLYELLEPETARTFKDEFVSVSIDASRVIWVATANDTSRIPPPLLSRFTVFSIEAPDEEGMRRLIRTRFRQIRGVANFAPLADDVVDELRQFSAREIGQRLRVAMGRAALRAANDGQDQAQVCVADLGELPRQRPPLGFR